MSPNYLANRQAFALTKLQGTTESKVRPVPVGPSPVLLLQSFTLCCDFPKAREEKAKGKRKRKPEGS
jgi:hypothetical protein